MISRHDRPTAHARAPRCHARTHQTPAPDSSPCENPVQQQPSHPSRQRGPSPPPPRQEPDSTTETAAGIPNRPSHKAANQQSRAAGFRALRRCWVAPALGGLVDGADTTALLLAAGVNLANRGADRPSAPECCIAGADRQPLRAAALDQRCQENRGQTTQTDTRSQRNRASRRGGHRVSTGSKPIVQTGLPGYVLQESPYPDQPTRKPRLGHNPHRMIFMPRAERDCPRRSHPIEIGLRTVANGPQTDRRERSVCD